MSKGALSRDLQCSYNVATLIEHLCAFARAWRSVSLVRLTLLIIATDRRPPQSLCGLSGDSRVAKPILSISPTL